MDKTSTEVKDIFEEEYSIDEHKFPKTSLRGDHEFYHDEDNVVYSCVEVKRKSKKEELWEFINNKVVLFKVKAESLTPKQLSFVRSLEGIKFLIETFKSGVNNEELMIARINDRI